MYYLFTGAAGYIGSHTAYYFLKHSDCKICIYDDLSTGFKENIDFLQAKFPNQIHFIHASLSDESALDEALVGVDAILHFAGSLIVEESIHKPLVYFQNNVSQSLTLLKLAQKHKIPHFLFSSSAAVYGESTNFAPLTEQTPTHPINPYGQSKLMVEQIIQATQKAYPHFHSVILRYFNVAGALQDKGLGQRSKKATHLIKIACECATKKREQMQIYGTDYLTKDGTCVRDFIHIDDLASAHFEALKTLRQTNQSQIYNVGYAQGYSVKEVIDCLKDISGYDFPTLLANKRAGDPAYLVCNNQKILHHTAWNPKHNSIRTICQSAYEWELSLSS